MQIEDLINAIRQFRDERDWKKFHRPKDLSTAIGIEAAELQEISLWKISEIAWLNAARALWYSC